MFSLLKKLGERVALLSDGKPAITYFGNIVYILSIGTILERKGIQGCEVALLVKGLPYKHEDLRSINSTYEMEWWHILERERQADSWGSTRQPN